MNSLIQTPSAQPGSASLWLLGVQGELVIEAAIISTERRATWYGVDVAIHPRPLAGNQDLLEEGLAMEVLDKKDGERR